MVASRESPTQHTSLTDRFATTAEKKGTFAAPSPDKFITPDISASYTTDELFEMNTNDLKGIGYIVEDILDMIDEGISQVDIVEKNAGFEKALEWGTAYWESMNKTLARKLEASNSDSAIYYTDVRVRAMGVKKFLDSVKKFTTPEAYEELSEVMLTACDMFIVAESDTGKLSTEPTLLVSTLSRTVEMAMENPEQLDRAVKLSYSGLQNEQPLRKSLESVLIGVKHEFVAAQIISSYEYRNVGYDISFNKPAPYRDVTEGADFVLTIADGRYQKELVMFDIKNVVPPDTEGCCRIEPISQGVLKISQGDFTSMHLMELFHVENNFADAVLRRNELGILVRLPRKLVVDMTFKELSELDNGTNTDYNEAKSSVFRELSFVHERIGK